MKTIFPKYGYSQVKDKTVARPSYLQHGDRYTSKTTSLYWDGPHNDILCTMKWAQKQTTLIWSHQQMTTTCTTGFTVVQPVVTDRNRSHYLSRNCSTNGMTNRLNQSNEHVPRQYQKVCIFPRWTNGLPGVKCCTHCVNPNPGTFRKLHNGLTRD